MPETSVIIRTFNEEKHLPGLLEGLARQSYRDFEVVVVDSGSLDRTREIAAQSADKALRIESHDFTFGFSLNVGIRAAKGRYIAIVSAHTLPVSDEWLDALIEPLRNEQTAMSCGRLIGWSTSKYSEAQYFRRVFGPRGESMRLSGIYANNANAAIGKELWEQHAFDETLPGLEDVAWARHWMEQGYQVVYRPEAAVYHIHDENWRQVRHRYYREAVAARAIGVRGPRHALPEVAEGAAHLVLDLGTGLWPFASNGPGAKQLLSRAYEIPLYHFNKAFGTVKGLLGQPTELSAATRQELFFDRPSQAVVIRGPGRAELEQVPLPDVKPGDVMVRVAYEGICATDLEILDGSLGYYKNGLAKYPVVPGHECSGRIVATGPNVNGLREGDPVVVECIQSCGTCPDCRSGNTIACVNRTELGVIGRDGGYAEHVVVPGRFVHRIPSSLDLRKACLTEPLAVVLKGLRRVRQSLASEPGGKRAAIVGAGPLGHLCARVLARQGYDVTAFDRDPRRREYFDGSSITTSDDLTELARFTFVVEATGNPEALESVLRNSGAGATILLMGLPYGERPFSFEDIVAYDKTIVGSVGSDAETFEEAIDLLYKLDLSAYLQHSLPLEQFRKGWDDLRKRKGLKVLLTVDRDLS